MQYGKQHVLGPSVNVLQFYHMLIQFFIIVSLNVNMYVSENEVFINV
jgi:hypothetical protein